MLEEQRIQHEYLLADFQATKAEIARRSNAQKTALAAIVVFYAWLLNQLVSTGIDVWHISAIWIVTILGYSFYRRETLEIKRLGTLIETRIAKVAANDLNIPAEKILPSEVKPADERYDNTTRVLDWVFSISIFAIIPLTLTVLYFL